MEKITITIFTDPMMGLSYESQSLLDTLREIYGEKLEFRYTMCLLVRDIAGFMSPGELAMPKSEGIKAYNARLAQIYKSEEIIGNLPMNMENFCLFDENHRSFKSLNLAVKAVEIIAPELAEAFFIALRRATVTQCAKTTHFSEILKIVREMGIYEAKFKQSYLDGSAEDALQKDLDFARNLGACLLPAYLFSHKNAQILMQSFDLADFTRTVEEILKSTKI